MSKGPRRVVLHKKVDNIDGSNYNVERIRVKIELYIINNKHMS